MQELLQARTRGVGQQEEAEVPLGVHARRRPDQGWDAQQIDDLLFYGVLGVILGGRLDRKSVV